MLKQQRVVQSLAGQDPDPLRDWSPSPAQSQRGEPRVLPGTDSTVRAAPSTPRYGQGDMGLPLGSACQSYTARATRTARER